jgi:hypothetical protein
MDELQTHWGEGNAKILDPQLYAANTSRDEDIPSFHEAIHGNAQEQYLEAMNIEIASLLQQ